MSRVQTIEMALHAAGNRVIGGNARYQDEVWLFLNL